MPMIRPIFVVLSLVSLVAFGCKGGQKTPGAEGGNRQVKTKDLEPGDGEAVQKGYLILAEYNGRVKGSDTPFDTNETRDANGVPTKAPLSTVVGSRTMIVGFDDALIGMKKGMVREMEIPWEKGYGAEGNQQAGIPPKSDLVFKVKLLGFVKPDEQAAYDVEDTVVGTGREVKAGDTVTIHYRGTYLNGMMFDDSHLRGETEGGTPYTFKVGKNQVISGVDDGILGMKVGGKRRLVLPPGLAFGAEGFSTIQGNQVLLIDIELLKVE